MEISLVTAFPGLGGRDAFEIVTRCVTDGRLQADKDLPEAANELESPHGRYYFRFAYRGREVVVTIKPGFVKQEFIQLARKENLTPEEAETLIGMKKEMAARLLAAEPEEIYNAEVLYFPRGYVLRRAGERYEHRIGRTGAAAQRQDHVQRTIPAAADRQ